MLSDPVATVATEHFNSAYSKLRCPVGAKSKMDFEDLVLKLNVEYLINEYFIIITC